MVRKKSLDNRVRNPLEAQHIAEKMMERALDRTCPLCEESGISGNYIEKRIPIEERAEITVEILDALKTKYDLTEDEVLVISDPNKTLVSDAICPNCGDGYIVRDRKTNEVMYSIFNG